MEQAAQNEEHEPEIDAGGPPTLPYGSWPSAIRIDDLVGEVVRLSDPWVDGDDVYWIEGRPAEGGRSVLVLRSSDGVTRDITPPPFDVRSRVHEYGGGAYVVAGGTVLFSHLKDGRLYRLDPGDDAPQPLTPEGPFRYADLRFDPARRRFLAIREDHTGDGDPRAAIVDIALDGDRPVRVLYEGPDFLAAPRPSPDGHSLAWLEWDLPDMPWDVSRLRVAPFLDDGGLGPSDLAAGGSDESIAQPEWSPDGLLHFVSDRTGWWNIYRLAQGPRLENLTPIEAEFADPAWVFDRSSYGFLADGAIVGVGRSGGRDRIFHIAPGDSLGEVASPYTDIGTLRVGPAGIVANVGTPTVPSTIVSLDPATLTTSGVLRHSTSIGIDAAQISVAEPITFPTAGGRMAHALFYRPVSPDVVPPDGDLPPLLVRAHGGPTSSAVNALELTFQYLTSRGIAVVDVDYGGSTGYGREYRQSLQGQWGIVDVDDAVNAALALADAGEVDRARLAITGGSAGGWTVLCAAAFHPDVFAAGADYFGVSDLMGFVDDTHKFESRYNDWLVGPWPEAEALWRERSPVNFADRIRAPIIILQGLEDAIVPPSQSEVVVKALRENRVPFAYLTFEGEQHGFRKASSLKRAVEAELSFYAQVLGFEPAGDIPRLMIVNLPE